MYFTGIHLVVGSGCLRSPLATSGTTVMAALAGRAWDAVEDLRDFEVAEAPGHRVQIRCDHGVAPWLRELLDAHQTLKEPNNPGIYGRLWTSISKTGSTCYFSTLRSHKSLEQHSVLRLFYLFVHLHLLSSDSFSSLIFSLLLFSFLTLPTSAFPSLHIVGSLTSKLPSMIIFVYFWLFLRIYVYLRFWEVLSTY